MSKPFNDVKRIHVFSFLNVDYDLWAQCALEVGGARVDAPPCETIPILLTALDVDGSSFHGVFTAAGFRSYFTNIAVRVPLHAALTRDARRDLRQTHLAIIATVESAALPMPPGVGVTVAELDIQMRAEDTVDAGGTVDDTDLVPRTHHFLVVWRWGGRLVPSAGRVDNTDNVPVDYQ